MLVAEDLEVESQSQNQASLPEERLCAQCDEPIPLVRLKAMPTTAYCVACLESSGDVQLLKRHDDYIGRHGDDVVSTYYKSPHQYMDVAVEKLMSNKTFQTTYEDDPPDVYIDLADLLSS